MSHFSALVLIPSDTNNIETKVRELLSPYYSDLEVEPYKEYFSEEKVAEEMEYLATRPREEIEKLAANWEVPSNDLKSLAKMEVADLLGWFEDEADGIDEKGLYKMTTINPLGKWDYYRFIEMEPIESGTPVPYPCRVADLPEVVPYALVTPDGQWHELGVDAGIKAFAKQLAVDTTVSSEEAQWKLKVQAILAHYSDDLAVALDCHI